MNTKHDQISRYISRTFVFQLLWKKICVTMMLLIMMTMMTVHHIHCETTWEAQEQEPATVSCSTAKEVSTALHCNLNTKLNMICQNWTKYSVMKSTTDCLVHCVHYVNIIVWTLNSEKALECTAGIVMLAHAWTLSQDLKPYHDIVQKFHHLLLMCRSWHLL